MSDTTSHADADVGSFVIVQLRQPFDDLPVGSLLEAPDSAPLAELVMVLRKFDSPPSRRLVTSVSLETLRKMEARAKTSPFPPTASLAAFWRIDLREKRCRIAAFLASIRKLEVVVAAYPDSTAQAPAVTPGDDPRYGAQGYISAAPTGIDAPFAWQQQGGDGTGIAIVDLEMNWNESHEDLAARNPTLLYGDRQPTNQAQNHGTACLAIMVGSDNTEGIVGVAPAAGQVKLVSHYSNSDQTGAHVAAAVTFATSILAPGDVLVLEVETGVGTTYPLGYPIEVKDPEYHAIRLAAGNGIIVIEAAGNAGDDLDLYVGPPNTEFENVPVLQKGVRDSGAILVGASTAGLPHRRLDVSNKGPRIDCHAWGEQVTTAGYGLFGDRNKWYTNSFSRTSAATAIIGGAALAIQGIAMAAGQRLTPTEMRTSLADWATGTEILGHSTLDPNPQTRIGVMPNLRRLLPAAGLVPDVELRNAIGDIDQVLAVGACPDIIVANQPVSDPNAAFGEGSGAENSGGLGTSVKASTDNYIYVRMRNRGKGVSTNTSATVYWGEPATLVMPSHLKLIGETTPAIDVPQGGRLAVSPALTWPAATVPATGSYCLVAVIGSDQDPPPPLPAADDWQAFLTFIASENNAGWCNTNVVSLADWHRPHWFWIAGATDKQRLFDFAVIQWLPEGAQACLQVDADLAKALAKEGWQSKHDAATGTVSILLPPRPSLYLAGILLERDARHRAELVVRTDRGVGLDGHSITVRQLFSGIEVGRITWRFVGERSHTN